MKKNKFLLGTLLGFFSFLGLTIAATTFSDIAGHWAEDNLTWAVNNGLLKGDDVAEGEPKTLRPNDEITRAEMVTILKRYDELLKGVKSDINEYTGSFSTKIGGITWMERTSVNNEGELVYQAVKMDKSGSELVLYEKPLDSHGDIEWDFSEGGNSLVIKGGSGGPEGGVHSEIAFMEGEETIRSNYEQYGSYESDLTFKLPDSPLYTVTLVTSEECEGVIPDPVVISQTELLGIKITSENGSQSFDLTEPAIVDCAMIDGSFVNHHPQNIVTSPYGISFTLPNGDTAWLSIAEGVEKMSVFFAPADSNYI